MTLMPKKALPEKILLQALAGQATAQIPFWLMRQAGRYLPEYRQLRQTAGSFLDLCFNPEFATEVTLQPLRRFDMDAAILFSDILVVPYALGQALDFVEGEGPKLGVFKGAEVFAEIDFDTFDKKLQPVYETVRRVRAALSPEKALLGFAGAPWTVACYMIQGHGGGEFAAARKFALEKPQELDRLINTLVTVTAHYLIRQIKSGADAVQLFDSWAGLLPAADFERWIIHPAAKIVQLVRQSCPGVPLIGFPRQAGAFYKTYAEATGFDGIGIDPSFSVQEAVKTFGGKTAVQGNLDPALLLEGGQALEENILRILTEAGQSPFIFNLGHGIIKETPPEHVAQLAQIIRNYQR